MTPRKDGLLKTALRVASFLAFATAVILYGKRDYAQAAYFMALAAHFRVAENFE